MNSKQKTYLKSFTVMAICFLGSSYAVLATPVSPFATEVVEYLPAPGYFVNQAGYGDPLRALGAPVGGGMRSPTNDVVSLGAFGGSITLSFERTVRDDPNNPMGLDAIVFSNALFDERNGSRFQEPGIIEISRDVNGNGLPDDPWYVIPGSHLVNLPGLTNKRYHKESPLYPPEWKTDYPNKYFSLGKWDQYPDDITLSTYLLPGILAFGYANPNTDGTESVWGYADCSPTLRLGDLTANDVIDDFMISPEEFYATPDDPKAAGWTPGSGGGDAFDIAWAVDWAGNPANLDGFDFIRITTGVDVYDSQDYYEASTEIDAVADVSPMPQPIRALKNYPDRTGARLSQAMVTAAFTGEFYVRDTPYSGIKVKSSVSVTPGELVNVIGSISSVGGQRYICTIPRTGAPRDAFVRVTGTASEAPRPIGMACALIGGEALTAYTPGVKDGKGLNNIGSLIRTWGRVVGSGADYLLISDGSLEALKVYPVTPDNAEYVVVTGIVACEQAGADIAPVIRPLTPGGVVKIK